MFVTIDAVGAGNLIQDGMKAAITAATGIPADLILIGQTHSHASADLQGLWGGVPDEWVRNTLYKMAAQAAKSAKDAALPAKLTYATGEDAAFANYRRPRVDLNAKTDPNLSVLQAKDNNGNVLGTIVQYAAHPTTIGEDANGNNGRIVHADYVLGLEDAMEAASGGATALYYNGPIADASPAGDTVGVNDYERVRSRGQCLAQSALALLNPQLSVCSFSKLKRNTVRQTELNPTIDIAQKTATLPVTNPLFLALGASGQISRYYDFSLLPLTQVPVVGAELAAQQPNLPQVATTATTLVSRITIGGAGSGLEIVTVPGETTNTYGQYIRALTTNKNMMLFGLTHNSFGYIIPEDEFSYLDASGSAGFVLPFTGYEEFVSLGPLTAPLLRLTAYNPLFGISTTDPRNIPPSLAACSSNPASNACLVWRQMLQLDYIQRSYAETCRSNLASNVPGDAREQAEAFCDLLDPKTPLYQPCMDAKLPVAVCNTLGVAPGTTPPGSTSPYGEGALGALSQFMADLNGMIAAMLSGDAEGTGTALQTALGNLSQNASTLTAAGFPGVLGLGRDPQIVLANAVSAKREAAPVILTGSQVLGLSVRSAQGVPYPYPSGANITGQSDETGQLSVLDPLRDPLHLGEVRDAHNGIILYPSADDSNAPMGIPVERIAAYAWKGNAFVEIPVQVDQKFPFFLANAGSSFSVYSGTDEELTYQWDVERWSNADSSDPVAHFASTMQDPVSGFDDDDEIAFMYSDAGAHALTLALPSDPNLDTTYGVQEVALLDPLSKDPTSTKFVYIGVKKSGVANKWHGQSHYVSYTRDDNADQWIDRNFFRDEDPQKLGTSNTNYGPNHHGKVAPGNGYFGNPGACTGTGANRLCDSTDRFARDGVTVTTDQYVWRATGRWMVREISVADPDHPGLYGSDLIDRWKGRAFQQSPDSIISLVGFEDEQVNWEANSTLLGERCGPVRCMREVWGADSGTNVTKTETFYRGNVTYRYHVRVHPIPPDGLYTAWDYNRSAMIPTAAEAQQGVKGGRYYTMLRPQGVPIDGVNDDVGQIDNLFGQPAFFDFPDPTFNLPLAFDSWEQVSGKGRNGSLVYTFEMKGATSVVNPIVVPYYRDDACLDDGTGDDPVQRPYPGDSTTDAKVRAGYAALANKPYAQLTCADRQGAYGEHGIHYLVTHDTDNAFLLGKPITEVDGQQWQFMVPTSTPANVAEPYANNVRIPLLPVVIPRPGIPALGAGATQGGVLNYLSGVGTQIQNLLGALASLSVDEILDVGKRALDYVVDGLNSLLYTGGAGTVSGTVSHVLAGDGSLVGIIGGLVNDLTQVILGAPSGSKVRVGVGVVDMTPDVGYCAGQYCEYTDILDGLAGGDIDPYLTHKLKKTSYGVQSRLTARAIVIEGSNGKKIALLKSDNYVAQDFLIRRVGQILDQGQSGIGYEQILYHVSHNHSAAYSSSPAVGLAVFQDAFDPRFFENQARRLAAAIEIAAANMKPARMGATVIKHRIYKGNIVRTANADDGTPAGYPLEYNDHGLTVVRFDAVDSNGNFSKPIATWMNWGEHPESLDGYNLHSADYLGPLERWVERETGAPLVFSQGDVGSAESSGNTDQRNADNGTVCGTRSDASQCPFGQGALRDWEHQGYAQTERNARFLADDVVKAWNKIGSGDADVVIPLTRNFPVDYANAWVPGPLSHPYPSISNCRTQTTLEGDLGIPAAGLPDCARRNTATDLDGGAISGPLFDGWQEITNVTQSGMIYALLRAEGVPVPEHYDVPAFSAVEENLRLKLQAFRLGEILLASCACEAQNDLVLNIKSRLDAQRNNIYDGFDWACLMPQYSGDPKYVAACETQKKYFDPSDPLNATLVPGTAAAKSNVSLIARMRAQVHNDARGWDSAQNVALANAESADINKIWGNFTKEEIQDLGILDGYKLPVAIGHAGDYNGYTLSYREYMNRDSYRKALTSYGPHTADYMATRLVRMAAQLKGGADFVPEAHNALAQTDELRQQALAVVLGQATSAAYDGFHAVLADDMGPVAALTQPQDVTRFAAATFSWRGGTTAQDNPLVTVERCTLYPQPCTKNSDWTQFADMSGEVQTRVAWPQGIPGVIAAYTGTQEWKWTANFEAYSAFPARLGSTPEGQYRFRVNGMVRKNRAPSAYALVSNAFQVKPWPSASGVAASRNSNTVSFNASSRSVSYPKSYSGSAFPYVAITGDAAICDNCSFRPWASVGQLAARGDIVVLRAGVVKATRNATCQIGAGISCTADLANLSITNGDILQARIYDQDGNYLFATVP
ncbi:MAG: neutral/alkaline non-lysosomal ceramidase N-terminal domain-containing protein [Pseudomonadota bacterium]